MSGKLDAQKIKICHTVLEREGTAREIADRLGMDLQSVTPRIGELKRLDLVQEVGTKPNPGTNRPAVIIGPTHLTRRYLDGLLNPRVKPSRRDRETAVIDAARSLLRHRNSKGAWDHLALAVAELDTYGGTN